VKSPIVKRSIVIAGHKTSVSIEDAFWTALKDIAASRGSTVAELVAAIDAGRRHGNLSSAVRMFVLDYFRAAAGGERQRSDASVGAQGIRH
jgi:predicted DNA-binding ribbon-helix-helix protein